MMKTPPLNPHYRIPLLVLDGEGVLVVEVPLLSEEAFEFLKKQLDVYRPAIVRGGADSARPRPMPLDPDEDTQERMDAGKNE